MLGCLAGYIVGGFLGRLLERAVGVAERSAERVPIPQLLCGILGGGLGGVVGLAVALPLALLIEPAIGLPAGGIALWLCMYLGYRIASHRTEELFAMIGLSTRPLVRARAYDDADGFLVDSSAVMDTQLLPLCRSGLFRDDLLVPRFVLDELQGMADAGDERGRRARRGLETLDVLQRDAPNRVYIVDDEVPEVREVDAKLVALARRLQVRLLTNDVNLARVAEVQGVLTVIPRRLAADLVPGVLAGESIRVALDPRRTAPGSGRRVPRGRLDGRRQRRGRSGERRADVVRGVVDRAHERRPHRVRPAGGPAPHRQGRQGRCGADAGRGRRRRRRRHGRGRRRA